MDEDILARLNDSQHRDRILDDFNQSTLDDVGPVGGEKEFRVLEEMNDLVEEVSRPPRVHRSCP